MKKKPRILQEIDDFVLQKLHDKTTPEPEPEEYFSKCKKCTGKMELITPIVEMPFQKDMVLELHECSVCHEREYL